MRLIQIDRTPNKCILTDINLHWEFAFKFFLQFLHWPMPFGKHAIIETRLFLGLYRTLIEWNLVGTIEKKARHV